MCLAVVGRILEIGTGLLPELMAPAGGLPPPAAATGLERASLASSPVAEFSCDPFPLDLWRCGRVDFGGVCQLVSLALLPDACVGDRVLVHVGVALTLVQEECLEEGP